MSSDPRLYKPSDRTRLREIFQDTAFLGESVRRYLDNGEWLADVLTAYYTDVDSGCTWVIEEEGQVIGYLTGAPDTAHFHKIWIRKILPRVIGGFFSKGLWKNRRTWVFLWHSLRASWAGESESFSSDFDTYPAHFHINLDARHRGRGAGQKLVAAFLNQLQTMGIQGVHLRTSSRGPTRSFFETCGFHVVRRSPFHLWVYLGEPMHYLITYGKTLREKNDTA